MAEWLGNGLQNRSHRFNSGPGLINRKNIYEQKIKTPKTEEKIKAADEATADSS